MNVILVILNFAFVIYQVALLGAKTPGRTVDGVLFTDLLVRCFRHWLRGIPNRILGEHSRLYKVETNMVAAPQGESENQ